MVSERKAGVKKAVLFNIDLYLNDLISVTSNKSRSSAIQQNRENTTAIETYCTVRVPGREVRFGPNVGQIVSKYGKSGNFLDQLSVNFGSPSQNVLKSDLEKKISNFSHFRSVLIYFWANLTHLGTKYDTLAQAKQLSLI